MNDLLSHELHPDWSAFIVHINTCRHFDHAL
jgi:hypothetical protein